MVFDSEMYKKVTTAVRQVMLAFQAELGGSVLKFAYEHSALGHILNIRMSWVPSMDAELPGFDPGNLLASLESITAMKATIETKLKAEIVYFGYERDANNGHIMITKLRWAEAD